MGRRLTASQREKLHESRDIILARCKRFGPQTPSQIATALLQVSPVSGCFANEVEREIDALNLPIEKQEQWGYSQPIYSDRRKAKTGKTDRYVRYAAVAASVAQPVAQTQVVIAPQPTQELKPMPEKNTVDRTEIIERQRETKRQACLAAARELAEKGKPLVWVDIVSLARRQSGLTIAEQFLAPSNHGASIRQEIHQIFGVGETEEDLMRQKLTAQAERIAALEAALDQVQQFAPSPQTEDRPSSPVDFLAETIERCQSSLRRLDREQAQLEADRNAVVKQLAAAKILLEATTGEPQQGGQLVQFRTEVA